MQPSRFIEGRLFPLRVGANTSGDPGAYKFKRKAESPRFIGNVSRE
jgi:hypothetical protein